jgi:tRNA G18 (ribose-2'-O)-methylase SpoU
VRLPMTGTADSLNVAVATGVVLYELVRRNQ